MSSVSPSGALRVLAGVKLRGCSGIRIDRLGGPEKPQRNPEKPRRTPRDMPRETPEKPQRNPEKPQRAPKDRATHTPGEASTSQEPASALRKEVARGLLGLGRPGAAVFRCSYPV